MAEYRNTRLTPRLWPLLHLDALPSAQAPETWFPYGVHVLIWTAALYGVFAVFQRAQKR